MNLALKVKKKVYGVWEYGAKIKRYDAVWQCAAVIYSLGASRKATPDCTFFVSDVVVLCVGHSKNILVIICDLYIELVLSEVGNRQIKSNGRGSEPKMN